MTKEKLTAIEKAATDMMFLFIMLSDENGKVTGEGLEKLSTRFGDVPEADRADVYVSFVDRLKHHSISFDQTQWAY